MKRYITTIVESVPENLYLVSEYKDIGRKTKNGKTVLCADVIKPFKKVILFDEDGEMTIKYYTEHEWNDTNCYDSSSNYRKAGRSRYKPCLLSLVLFKSWLNRQLEDVSPKDAINDLMKGLYNINPEYLDSETKAFIKKILESPDDYEVEGFDVFALEDFIPRRTE